MACGQALQPCGLTGGLTTSSRLRRTHTPNWMKELKKAKRQQTKRLTIRAHARAHSPCQASTYLSGKSVQTNRATSVINARRQHQRTGESTGEGSKLWNKDDRLGTDGSMRNELPHEGITSPVSGSTFGKSAIVANLRDGRYISHVHNSPSGNILMLLCHSVARGSRGLNWLQIASLLPGPAGKSTLCRAHHIFVSSYTILTPASRRRNAQVVQP